MSEDNNDDDWRVCIPCGEETVQLPAKRSKGLICTKCGHISKK